MKERLTSGTFAKLCGTTKATLRWYRKTGLLEPAQIDNNDYAYYTKNQIVQFLAIRELRNIGYSIEQIKANQICEDDITNNSFFDEQITRLDQAIAELQKRRTYLEYVSTSRKELVKNWGLNPSAGDWHIRYRHEEYYLTASAPVVDFSVYQQNLAQFQSLCNKIGLGTNAPVVMFIDKSNLMTKNLAEGYCVGTKISDPSVLQITHEVAGLIYRKAGDYLNYLTTIPLQTDMETDKEISSNNNIMIEKLNTVLTFFLSKGYSTEMGMLITPLATLPDEKGVIQLFLEVSVLRPMV